MKKWFLSFVLVAFTLSGVSLCVSTPLEARDTKSAKKYKKKKVVKRKKRKRRARKRRPRKSTRKAKPYNPLYAFIVVDAASGKVLSSLNANAKTYPASLTKMMTAYLVFEGLERGTLRMNQRLKISRHAARQAPGKLWLKSGKTISLKQALYATVVKSANDAAVVLGEAVGGTESNFAYLMTKKARELGMYRTFFKNASGLPNRRQITTARDMMLLARALYHRFPKYYSIFGQKTFQYGKRKFRSTNKLLGRVKGVDGIKTGYIRLSGFNLAASALRDGRRIIAVVMGGKTRRWRDQQMTRLINSTFNAIGKAPAPRPILKPDAPKNQEEIEIETHDIVKLLDKSRVEPSHPSEGPRPLPESKLARMKESLMETELDKIQQEEDLEKPAEEKAPDESPPSEKIDVPSLPAVKALQLDSVSEQGTTLADVTETSEPLTSALPSEEKPAPSSTPPEMSKSRPKWAIQVGAYRRARSAYTQTRTIIERYKLPGKTFVIRAGKGKRSVYKAQIKHLTESQAQSACKDMKTKKEGCLVIAPRR